MQSPIPAGSFLDAFPLTVLTTSTLAHLTELQPQSDFDARRFRMNVIVDSGRAGFIENQWVGRQLELGDAVQVHVAMPDARCVMTTLAQDDLPEDIDVLRALVRHNRLQVGDLGQFPCAGVYAVVAGQGTLRVADPVVLN